MNSGPSLIVGYGNLLRSDDGIGAQIARMCRAAGQHALEAHQLLPEHAERLAGMSRVVFVDCHLALAPGQVVVMPIQPGGPALHEPCSPASLIALARDVYGAAPDAYLVGVGPASLEFGETLSYAVRAAIPEIMRTIDSLVEPLFSHVV